MEPQKYESFIENTIKPLIDSKVQTIIVCIDPLVDCSDVERLTTLSQRLTSMDTRIITIVPSSHVNAAVGRNITFNCIRQMENDRRGIYKGFTKHLLWFGSDDDDRIITEGMNGICELIIEEKFHISTVLTINPSLNEEWRRDKGQKPTHHYAQWCYCFSPAYYNGLSYPITPLEKEDRRFAEASGSPAMLDLDVLNRLFQYPQFFVTLDEYSRLKGTSITYPYEYRGTNSDRPRADDLYNRVDVIDYLNAHHLAETNDIKLNAPSAGAQKRGYKAYYMNDSERYFAYDSIYGSRNNLYYGIALHNDPTLKTHTDSYNRTSPPTLLRLIEIARDPKFKELLHRENFNGDLYMVRYTLFTHDRVLYGLSFQNGKDPFDIITNVERTNLTKKIKRRFMEAKTVGDALLKAFACNPLIISTDKRTQLDDRIQEWNVNVLSERTPRNHIPLRTFGGNSGYGPLKLLILLTGILILTFAVSIICKYMNSRASDAHNSPNGSFIRNP